MYNKMENNCDNILKIMKESFNQIYKNKRYNVIMQTIEEKIEIDKIKTMNIANYLKSVEVYSIFCNKQLLLKKYKRSKQDKTFPATFKKV